MGQFVVVAGPDSSIVNHKFQLHDGDTIGRSPGNKIYLNSESVFPKHVRVVFLNNKVQLVSLDSKAEFFVNFESVSKALLRHGDMVKIGEYELMFEEEEPTSSVESIDHLLKPKIESRVKYYETVKHVLDSFKTDDRSQRRLVTLYKISNTLSGILDLEELLKSLLEIILQEFSADRAFIFLYEAAKDKLSPAAALSTRGEIINPKMSASIVKEVFSTKESLLCENIMEDARFKAQDSLVRHNVMSAMCIPLIRKGEILGILQVDSHRRGKFSKNDLDLLTQVAMQAAMVIENARLFRARQQFNQNLLALSQATQALSSYLRSDLILADTPKYAEQIFSAERSLLFLKEAEQLKLVAATGVDEAQWANFRVPECLRQVAYDGKALLITPSNSMAPEWKDLLDIHNSLLAVAISINPLEAATEPMNLGILCIINHNNAAPYTMEDQQLLRILADYTAIALSNASFYKEMKQKEEEIARWNVDLEKRVQERTEQLEAVHAKLNQSEKMAAVGLLAAGVSHEFNNIIASMYGFAQIAVKNEKYKDKLVQIVIEQCKRACEITEGLLSFSKQKGDTAELADIHKIIDSVLALTSTALENEGIEVVKQYGTIPKTMMAAGKIQQVFMNIIINARHAIEKNGTITICTYLSEDQKWLHATFADTGIGIKEENLKKIFEPFYTTKGSFGGGTQPGTGIGLALCYNIVQQHGGDITLVSKYGEGTCFDVMLPVTQEVPPNMKAKEERKEVAPAVQARKGQKILVVEDTDAIRELLCHILRERAFDVYEVNNGTDAIELCKKEIFDYVFLDIRMPGAQDGFSVFDEVKRLEPNTKVIVITGRAEDATLMKYVGTANGYLRKPFDIADIDLVLSGDVKGGRRKKK